jgi:hypothetical protein
MKPYEVIIRAIIVKSIRVQAESQEEAIETAHDLFTSDCDDQELRYEQETIDVLQPELITGE